MSEKDSTPESRGSKVDGDLRAPSSGAPSADAIFTSALPTAPGGRRPPFRSALFTTLLFAAASALHAATPAAPTPAKSTPAKSPAAFDAGAFTDQYCSACHDDIEKKGGLDITALTYNPAEPGNLGRWIKIHDRLAAGEMPPKEKKNRPDAAELSAFLDKLSSNVTASDRAIIAAEGRATQRRLNGYEYENALRDLLSAPWLQVKGQFPDDGEAFRFNKIGDALDVSHVHLARYMSAADYALRQAMSVQYERPPTTTKRYYARDQRTLTSKFTPNPFNTSLDRMTYPLLGFESQPAVRSSDAPVTVGDQDHATRDLEAVGWVSSNYVTGFTYRWDGFRAPVAGRYRVKFSGFTMWAPPGGQTKSFSGSADKAGKIRPPNPKMPNYDKVSRGRTQEPVTVYTRNGLMNRRVGSFDLTPEPGVYDIGEVWLLANETLVPDASRFYRSRPTNFVNPLMTPEGAPSVAFRWMEVEGPLYDESSTAGYKLLFGDLPMAKVKAGRPGVTLPVVDHADRREGGRNAGQRVQDLSETTVDVISKDPVRDSERLLRGFLARAYRRPVQENDVQRFLALINERRAAGLSFAESMLAGYTAVLASPGFVFLNEQPGELDDAAVAMRLSLFLWNSTPDAALRARAEKGELRKPEVLRAETERMLNDPKSQRFQQAFLDYWVDLRKLEDSTPSTTLYNDYYLDDSLAEAAQLETQLYFDEMVRKNLPARNVVESDFTYVNERLATHYGIPGVKGIAMRRITLPPESVRGGFLTQASVLKITANGTTSSPVLRGKWIVERILGMEIPPPPPVAAVDPDIRGAVTLRQQLDKHRNDASCASCHSKIDPPGFALENFDVMGAWRDQYRGLDEKKTPVKGIGKNGHAFEFHYAAPVDPTGQLPDGRPFKDIRDFKRIVREEETMLARNLAKQLVVYGTGAPIRFSDRPEIEKIVQRSAATHYGLRTLIHEVVESPLFLNK